MTAPEPNPKSAEVPTESQVCKRRYWRSNLKIMGVLLLIWAGAGFGAAILFADKLNEFRLPGTAYPLGFWFAHQGAIVVFVLVVLSYCILMNGLDRRHSEELTKIKASQPQP